jgi:hypothetical protein
MSSKHNWVTLTPEQELERLLPVGQAAEMNNVSLDTWRRRYPHLIVKISPRRNGVRKKHALNPPPPEAA